MAYRFEGRQKTLSFGPYPAISLKDARNKREAVENNPDKFPEGYVFSLNRQGKDQLVENFDRFNALKHSTVKLSVQLKCQRSQEDFPPLTIK